MSHRIILCLCPTTEAAAPPSAPTTPAQGDATSCSSSFDLPTPLASGLLPAYAAPRVQQSTPNAPNPTTTPSTFNMAMALRGGCVTVFTSDFERPLLEGGFIIAEQ